MISTIKHTYNFFKQPHRIGDVIDYEGKMFYVIGIENIRFGLSAKKIQVQYTVQEMHTDYVDRSIHYLSSDEFEFVQVVSVDDLKKRLDPWEGETTRPLSKCRPGQSFTFEGERYKIIEYTDIEVDSMDFKITLAARLVNPVSRKELKARLLKERKIRAGLSLL